MSEDVTIIGAGLAGLMLAWQLVDRGVEAAAITVVDADDDRRASDVPGALMHPFPGRSMAPKPGHMDTAKTSVDFLRRLRRETHGQAVVELPMVRPLVGGERAEMSRRLRTTWKESRPAYPDWFDSRVATGAALADIDPRLEGYDEALVYGPAFSVDTHRLGRHLLDRLTDAGVQLIDDTTVGELQRAGGRWNLRAASGAQMTQSTRVVLAIGWGLAEWFPGLPIQGRGGEVMVVRPPEGAAPLECVINASGHAAPLAGTPPRWSVGSTYWAPADFQRRSADRARRDLLDRCTRLVPALADAAPIEIGRGVRAMYRGDNRPLVGPIGGADDLFVLGAFGSKGLLRIPEFTAQLAALLSDGRPIDPRASTGRVNADKWSADRIW